MFKMARRDETEIYYDEEFDIVVIRQLNAVIGETDTVAFSPHDIEVVVNALLECANAAGD